MGTSSKAAPKKSTKDRLAEAAKNKIRVLVVGDKELKVYKWNYWTSIRLADTLTSVIGKVYGSFKGGGGLEKLLQTDFGEVLKANAEDILEVIVATIARDNFPSEEAAKEWAEEEIGLGEIMDLGVCIGKQNLRPLVAKIKEITGVDVSAPAEAPKASLAQTSLQSSSPPDSPTTG